ncbi:MAG: hypothetical protein ACYC61_23615, partial [Isosphaeraceae bacterium]
MTPMLRISAALTILGAAVSILAAQGRADDKAARDKAKKPAEQSPATSTPAAVGKAQEPPEINLLQAMNQGKVWVRAVGRSDGRLDVSLTNRTHKPLRVILPPGVVAQNATGQMGGMMGGMGGGMMGGGMGGMGGMGGGMGGMGGGMGGMGGGMGGMGGGMMGGGGMGGGGTMPPMMGMMML